ncbi:MAG: hypothetical protein NT055_08470, partial [Nitrospirae bacterium]|nr:hypothetical protein [Nitrospirota bacterium]
FSGSGVVIVSSSFNDTTLTLNEIFLSLHQFDGGIKNIKISPLPSQHEMKVCLFIRRFYKYKFHEDKKI